MTHKQFNEFIQRVLYGVGVATITINIVLMVVCDDQSVRWFSWHLFPWGLVVLLLAAQMDRLKEA